MPSLTLYITKLLDPHYFNRRKIAPYYSLVHIKSEVELLFICLKSICEQRFQCLALALNLEIIFAVCLFLAV